MKSLWIRYALILFLLVLDSIDSAAVGKGVGTGARGVKGIQDDYAEMLSITQSTAC